MKPAEDGSRSTFEVYFRIFRYFKPYLWRLIISMIITVPIGALDAAVAFSIKPFLDGLSVKQSINNTTTIPLIIVGLTSLQGFLNYFSIYLNGWLGFHITSNIRQDLYKKLLAMDARYFDTTSSGMILMRYYRDPESVQTNLLENMKQILTRFFSSISLIGTMVFLSWKLSIVAVSVLLFILYPSVRIRKIIRESASALTKTGGEVIAIYNETVGGIKVINGFGMDRFQERKFKTIQRAMYERTMKKVKAHGWMTPSMHLIAAIGVSLIIWQGSRMAISGEITTGSLIAFLAALIMLYNPIKNLGPSLLATQLSVLAAGRILDIIDMDPAIKDKPEALPMKGVKEGITFEEVSFKYNSKKRPVLNHFNLTIKAGETVALVGPSGSGKTTIANLIPRFYDIDEGAIRIDGTDIRDYQLESLRRHIAIVMQDNFLFNGTIEDNIRLGRPNATDEELLDAVDKAYLTEFVKSLHRGDMKQGLQTEVGERGLMLSGGQRQRIAIARALLKKAPIVILDEATSALDNESEAIVQKAIESLMRNKTVIVIAHRLSTIRNADRIVVMHNGKVAEEGTHDELLHSRRGIYRKLYETQFPVIQQNETLESSVL